MYPTVFSLGSFEVHTYGVLLTISFLAGIYLGMRRAKKFGIHPNMISDISMVIVISGLLGARALYVVYHTDEFQGRWLDTINPVQSTGQIGIAGLTLLGGFVLAVAASYLFCRWKRVSFLAVADILSPSLALGIGIARLGCLANGCCYGTPSDVFFAITYPAGTMPYALFGNVGVHPSPVYESIGGFLMFAVLLWNGRRRRQPGYFFGWFLLLYGILRFSGDFSRYYEEAMIVLRIGDIPLSLNQAIAFVMVLWGIYFLKFRRVTG